MTYLLFAKGILAGYITVLTDKIELGPGEKLPRLFWTEVPAIKIAQLAVDWRFARQGIGKQLVGGSLEMVREIRKQVGCRVVTLDAQPDLVRWYQGQGFQPNLLEQRDRVERARAAGRDAEHLPVSMRFDLREARR